MGGVNREEGVERREKSNVAWAAALDERYRVISMTEVCSRNDSPLFSTVVTALLTFSLFFLRHSGGKFNSPSVGIVEYNDLSKEESKRFFNSLRVKYSMRGREKSLLRDSRTKTWRGCKTAKKLVQVFFHSVVYLSRKTRRELVGR